MRQILILPAMFLTILLVVIFTRNKKFLSQAYSYSIDYAKDNNQNAKRLQEFIYRNDLVNDSLESSFLHFYTKRQEKVFIVRVSKNGRFENTQPAPDYFKNLFFWNTLQTLSVKKDGVIFKDIFSLWSGKSCSLKYFFNEHKLLKNTIYDGKYLVSEKAALNPNGETCLIIDKNWVLLIR